MSKIYRLTVRVGDQTITFNNFDRFTIDSNTISLCADDKEMAFISKDCIDDFNLEYIEEKTPIVNILTNFTHGPIEYATIDKEGIHLY